MAKIHSPSHGSMQFWPRVRAKRQYARVRTWTKNSKDMVLGFVGYKVGMTHLLAIDSGKTSLTKGEEIAIPVTVIECPPMKIAGVRLYKHQYLGQQAFKDILFKTDKALSRKIIIPKKSKDIKDLDSVNTSELSDIRLLAYTQPSLSGVSKKRPEFLELGMSGTLDERIKFVKEHHDKDLVVNTLFKEGEFVDIHAITKGKGLQGPVKRFGIAFKPHKTEKGVRRVGTLGAWSGQGHTLYRVPHPGQMGYHMRIEHNKLIYKISSKPEEINPKGAFTHYGNVKNTYLLIRGSVAGPQKRAIIFTKPLRIKTQHPVPTITYISKESKQ